MANYRIPKNVTTELKINKALYLTDLILLIGLLLMAFVLGNVVHSSFTWLFYGFMAVVAGLLIIRPATNPKKRMYEAIYLSIRRRKDTYIPVDYETEEIQENEGDQ
ncbi:DUF5592 family protein [Virgibacillus salexigens]|uniref:DUF5592 family protein n=1 Tax=Virgibacillus massiliensis TaxID=1462526 RepID=UPI001371866D|nr:DUF5592 family protein [Virgibacillus massiliensis]MYL43967.1 hypothetical protein [Virgibacillus massiliensis]